MATRIIKDNKERELTIMLTPFMPCSAKLPIISLFAGYFFPNNSGIISVSLYFLAIAVILISAIIINKTYHKINKTTFISELPEYKIPSTEYITRDVYEKVKEFNETPEGDHKNKLYLDVYNRFKQSQHAKEA